jgi:UDP-glucose 4-epimerase
MNKPTRIMITGGAGFIGSHLADALIRQGHRVSVVDNLSTGNPDNVNRKAALYKLDVNDSKFKKVFQSERPEVAFLFAYNTNVPRSVKDPVYDSKSLTGTLRTLEYARQCGTRKVIFSSTSFVYGNTEKTPIRETELVIPVNPYIITKSACEYYIQFYGKSYGLDYVIFRFATTYGPRQTGGAMADYVRTIHRGGRAPIYGDGTKTRDYLHVRDVVRACLLAKDYRPAKNMTPVFNLSTNKETSLNAVYHRIASLLGRPDAEPDYQPYRPGELLRMKLSNLKARKYLGWKPTIGIEQGLRGVVAHYLQQVNAAKGG